MNPSLRQPATKNFVISGTNFWNPGDDFVREGVIRILRQLFPDHSLNFLFYNFNADFFPQDKFSGIGNFAARGDLDRCRDSIDGVVIAGLSAGDEIKDLYRWVIDNRLEDRVSLIGAGYENGYVATHVGSEPEATIFKRARVITGRTAKTPGFIHASGIPYFHINCPAILSVPEVKLIPAGRKIERIGFSIQLPHGEGLVNQSCAREQFELAAAVLNDLARTHQVEVIAHHKTEYFHFLNALRGTGIPVLFSSFYHDLFDIYRRYDLVVTTRLHSSLFANGHGVPGIIINDTDRHTHTLDGFPHSSWVNTREGFDRAFARANTLDLARIAGEAREFKDALMTQYVAALSAPFGANATPAAPPAESYQFDSELKEQALVRRLMRPGMTVFDVGANIGKYTKLFSLLAGSNGRVFAFEPSPASCQRIEAFVRTENLSNVTLVSQAVCDTDSRLTLHQFPEEYSSWNSLGQPRMEDPRDPTRLVPFAGSVEVDGVTLDGFCRARGIQRIDYLKLDVEGAEFRALEGARQLLDRKAIGHLQFEISQRMLEGLNTTARRVFEFLEERGYECHAITATGEIGGLERDSASFYENYIAFPAHPAAALTTVAPSKFLVAPTIDSTVRTGIVPAPGRRADVPQSDPLPIHFFTIVLNGRPFIEQHIRAFEKLPFRWHWHIVEGVAELAHDTGWSRANGGRITGELHRNGLSKDGTSDYLDELARRFPANVTVYRKPGGAFWDGKLEMVNAPLANIREECLLWEVDADELWTDEQLTFARRLFLARPDKTAAYFFCHYFVGPELVTSTRDTYGNNTSYEWLRAWRFKPGCRWLAHEPPRLCQPNARGEWADVATLNPFLHRETEALDLVFQHYAYATEAQLAFKEVYYGYAGAVAQWRGLQAQQQFPVRLRDHFAWVKDGAEVSTAASQGIVPLLTKGILADGEAASPAAFKADAALAPGGAPTFRPRSEPQRILYVRTDAIGDAVLSAPILRELRLKFPQAQIAALCQEHLGEFYLGCPFVDLVIGFDLKRAQEQPAYRTTIAGEVAQFDPDLILNPVFSSDAVTEELVLSHARAEVVGFAGDQSNIAPEQHRAAKARYTHLIPGDGERKNELVRHRDFLAALGIAAGPLQPSIWTTPDEERFADEFFERNNLDPARTIALFPGSQHEIKVYPRFAEALGSLTGHRFLILGGPEVAPLAAGLASTLPALNLTGQTTIRQMASLIRRCRLHVGADSAGAHIACAVGTRNVVVLGGGHFGRFFPYSPLTSVACLPLDCYGCSWACKHPTAHCVKDLDPEAVAATVRAALAADAPQPGVFMQASLSWPERGALPRWRDPAEFLPRSVACVAVAVNPSATTQPALAAPLVSVLVSTYKSEKFIRACLEDLEAQTIADRIEIIVIDSGSPEDERAIVEEFQKRYPNIRYLRTERETLYAAWNRGVQMAAGKYVTNANADDSHRADALEKLVAALEAHPDADLSYGDYFTTTVPNDTFTNPAILRRVTHPPYQPATLMFYCVTGCHPMWRRTVFNKIGLFDAGYTAPGDYEFLLRFAQAGLRAVRVPEVLSLFYQNPDGLSFQRGSKADREFKQIRATYRAGMPIHRLYRVNPDQPADAARGWVALGNLALRHEVPWFDNASLDADYARRCYTAALDLDPQNVAARYNMVVAEILRGAPAQVEALFKPLPEAAAPKLRQSRQSGRFELIGDTVPAAVEALQFGTPAGTAAGTTAVRPPTASPQVPVRCLGVFFEHSDESRAARDFVEALAARLKLGAMDLTPPGSYSHQAASSVGYDTALRCALREYPMLRGGISVSDAPATRFQRTPDAVFAIGRTRFDVDPLPLDWARLCNLMDEIWVCDEIQHGRFAQAGVEADKLFVVPDATVAVARLREIECRLLTPSCAPVVAHVRGVESSPSAPGGKRIHIAWEGSFLDLGSLSHVNRELTGALSHQPEVRVSCIGKNGLPPNLASMTGLQEAARLLKPQSSKQTQITVRHAWPPSWNPPAHGAWVLIQPWEFGALPLDWTRQLGRVDEVWAPSEYVRRVYVDSGVPPDKVKIVPNGIDPQRFRPDAPPLKLATGKSFKFLFVGGTIQRKGPDVLLDAYLLNFTAADDVCLVIKDFGGKDVYAGQTFEAQIKAAQARPDAPEILYLNSDLSADGVAGLYTACDCLVHPYRGEGFGLPVLEAMACGIPVVVTGGGATDDFATDEFAYRVPALRQALPGQIGGLPLVRPGWWLEPDGAVVGNSMRHVFKHREEAREKGRRASEHVRTEWTWERTARIVAQRSRELIERLSAEAEATRARRSRKAAPIVAPVAARVGQLDAARSELAAGRLVPAWNAATLAIQARPHHPEAWLLLAEIAQAAGDSERARVCARHARDLAPKLKVPQVFPKGTAAKPGSANTELPPPPEVPRPTEQAPRLSVCIVTKNEEQFLPQCLRSIRAVAHQIVLVDTGSTDRTVAIAKEAGAEVYSFKWCDDFSAARNAALERASGDWILILDADEELPPASVELLKKEIQDAQTIAYRLPIVDRGREDEGHSYVPRLFRNAPGLFFVGRVHEQVFSSVEVRRREWGLQNKLSSATILHHGYAPDVQRQRGKVARNLSLLERAVEEMPNEPNLLMSYGLELMRSGQRSEGLAQYMEAMQAMSGLPADEIVPELRETLVTQFATHLLAEKDYAGVTAVLNSPLAKAAGPTASMHFMLGLALMESGRPAEAIEQFRLCLSRRDRPALAPIHKDIRGAAPHHCLAICLKQTNQSAAAAKSFEQGLQEQPDSRPLRHDYARFLAGQGQAVEGLQLLHQLVAENPGEEAAWVSGGQMALSQPDFLEFAADWTGEALKHFPDNPIIIEQRAQVLLLSQRVEESLPMWRRLIAQPTARRHAALLLCQLASDQRVTSAGPEEPAVSAEFVEWYRALLQVNAGPVIAAVNRRLDSLRPALPAAARILGAAVTEADEEVSA